jgi:hypothetical protein
MIRFARQRWADIHELRLETKQTSHVKSWEGSSVTQGAHVTPWNFCSESRTAQFCGNDLEKWTKWTLDLLMWRSGRRTWFLRHG